MENFISGVHNYCDRWCERCPLTNQCGIFEGYQDLTSGKAPNFDVEAFSISLTQNLKKAMEMIRESVEEQGLDWEKFHNDAVQQELTNPELTLMQQAVKDRAIKYGMEVKKWFDLHEEWLNEKEAELNLKENLGLDQSTVFDQLTDAIEIIKWYNFFIGPKLSRAIRGLHKEYHPQHQDPIQNDANGSAKITLIAIERSLSAWETIRSFFPEKTDDLLDLFRILAWLQRETLHLFPNAYKFIRPGFDEIAANPVSAISESNTTDL